MFEEEMNYEILINEIMF